jgi:cyclin A
MRPCRQMCGTSTLGRMMTQRSFLATQGLYTSICSKLRYGLSATLWDSFAHSLGGRAQQKYRPDPNYMQRQNDINHNMRGILVDWLVEVSEEYKLHTETLFLSINYIDRFLSRNNVQRGKLQLVGITCMLVAAKYEEIYPPSVEDFVYISDNAYTRENVIAEEVKLLNSLNFHCTVATSRQFLRRFAKAARADHETHELSHYLAELSLLDMQFVKYPPSVVAASALLIAINTTHLFGHSVNWDATMEYFTTYSFADLEPCANALLAKGREQLQHGGAQFRAVREKYMQAKFDMVAQRILPSLLLP